MVRTQVQLTEDQAETLRRLAKKNNISHAEVIRRALVQAARNDVLPDWDQARRQALAALGSVHSDATDLSTRHDDYFVEAILE